MALEHNVDPSAASVLDALSKGVPEAPLTHEAKSAFERVNRRAKNSLQQ
jgi:hypothetical protein